MGLIDRLFRRDTPPAPARRSFDGAMPASRRGIRNFGGHGPETLAAAAPLRSRARHAAANNSWVANGISAIVAEAVGAGIEGNSAHPDPTRRPDLDAAWDAFAAAEADAEGRTDLRGLLAQMVRAAVVDGESFALIEEDSDGTRVRLIPAEMVDETMTRELAGGGYVVAGVEFDGRGRRVAYHVLPHRPTDHFPTAAQPVRVPAEDVLHLMRPLGPGQVRGTSWLAPVLLTVNELDQLQDALLVGQKVSAMVCGFIIDQNDLSGGPSPDDDLEVSMEPGTLWRLGGGKDVRFANPDQASEGVAFARLTLGQIAAGLGVPQHLLDGDLSSANYSSLRAGLLPFRQKIEQFQYHCIVPQVLDPLWRRVMARAYLAGETDDLAAAQRVEWLMPRPMQVDPLKDTEALIAQIDAGLMSRRQAVASLGWNIDELDAEIAADRDRAAELGLNFST